MPREEIVVCGRRAGKTLSYKKSIKAAVADGRHVHAMERREGRSVTICVTGECKDLPHA